MNLYRFECTVFVRGNTAEEAEQHLADEVKYHFGMDNQLVAIDWSDPELDWSEPENAEE